jgi:hypothetical protein
VRESRRLAVRAGGAVERVIEVSGLAELLAAYPTVDAALAAAGS